jgi:zinc protease
MKKILGACLGLLILPAQATDVAHFQLENGLTILVKVDQRAPVVTSQVWYRVGASDELEGLTGIAHMFEHMMFKGSEKLKPGEMSKIIARLGGSENAFTGQDYTAYFQTVEKSHLKRMFELEAERMGHLKLDDAQLQKERKVVLEERRMRVEDQPTARLHERFEALAYDISPYRRPVIGWQQDIEGYTTADLQQWYQQHYGPNSATLVVAGDVDPQQVLAMAKATFGALPQRKLAERKVVRDLSPVGEKRLTLIDDRAKVPSLIMGYRVPSWQTSEDKQQAYALEVLANILDGGNSARFSKELLRGGQQLASVSVGYDLNARLSTLFTLSATPAEGVSLTEAEKAIKASLQRLMQEGISDSELSRVKAQVESAYVFGQDSLFYQAMKLGEAATVGFPLAEVEAYTQRIRAVTAEQVLAAAKQWLQDDRLTVAYLLPKQG